MSHLLGPLDLPGHAVPEEQQSVRESGQEQFVAVVVGQGGYIDVGG